MGLPATKMIAPDGKPVETATTKWCTICDYRQPKQEFYQRTRRRKDGTYASFYEYHCRDCRKRRWQSWSEDPVRREERARAFRELYAQDEAFRSYTISRIERARQELRSDPERLAQYRLNRRAQLARRREARLKQQKQLLEEQKRERKDPLCLRPLDPEGLDVLNRALTYAGGQQQLERQVGLAKGTIKHYLNGSRPITLELLDRVLVYMAEPMLDIYDFRRRSEWHSGSLTAS